MAIISGQELLFRKKHVNFDTCALCPCSYLSGSFYYQPLQANMHGMHPKTILQSYTITIFDKTGKGNFICVNPSPGYPGEASTALSLADTVNLEEPGK